MKIKITRKLFKIFFPIFVIIILVFTLKGVPGNPTPEEIFKELRSQAKPFELSPERGRYALASTIAETGGVYFSKEVAYYVLPDLGYANGRFVSLFAPGVSLISLPLYVIGKYLNLAQVFTFATSSFFALLNVFLIAGIVKKVTKNIFCGICAGGVFLFATNALSYATTLYQHHITTFLILTAVLVLISEIRFYTLFLVGSLYGTSLLVDYPNAVLFIPVVIFTLSKSIKIKEPEGKIDLWIDSKIITLFLGIFLFFIPNLVYNKIAYGNPFQLAGGVDNIREISEITRFSDFPSSIKSPTQSISSFFNIGNLPNSMSVLLTSKERGIFWFSPILLLGLLAIKPFYRKDKGLCLTLLAGVAATLLLYGMWGDPWGGWAFGPRYLIPALGQLAIFLGVAVDKYARKPIFIVIFFLTLIYGVSVNLAGALTTNQIPPSIEGESIDIPKIPYLKNFDLMKHGLSGSFIYNSLFKNHLGLNLYYIIILAVALLTVTCAYVFSANERREK